MRKFKILDIELDPSGPGPERIWTISYTAIKNKKWVTSKLSVVANNKENARREAEQRFGEKNV